MIHASNLNTIGNTYFNLGKNAVTSYLDSAAVYYKKAYEVAQSFVPPHKNSQQLYTLRKVKILAQKKEYNKALTILLSINNKDISSGVIQDINFLKSIVYYNLKKRDSTLIYANKFLSYEKNTPSTKINKIVPWYQLVPSMVPCTMFWGILGNYERGKQPKSTKQLLFGIFGKSNVERDRNLQKMTFG